VRLGVSLKIADILVRSVVSKFKKLKFKTHENIGYGEVDLPEDEMHTRSVVLGFDPDLASGRAFESLPPDAQGPVMRRLGYVIQQVAPVFLLCDVGDLGIAERLRDPELGKPCLYVYDSYPGGTGLSEGLLRNSEAILNACLEVIQQCPCGDGCPSCIGPPDRSGPTPRDESEPPPAPPGIKAVLSGFLEKIVRSASSGENVGG
jgi:DEAD/DEAH box helicase domain-containing protein